MELVTKAQVIDKPAPEKLDPTGKAKFFIRSKLRETQDDIVFLVSPVNNDDSLVSYPIVVKKDIGAAELLSNGHLTMLELTLIGKVGGPMPSRVISASKVFDDRKGLVVSNNIDGVIVKKTIPFAALEHPSNNMAEGAVIEAQSKILVGLLNDDLITASGRSLYAECEAYAKRGVKQEAQFDTDAAVKSKADFVDAMKTSVCPQEWSGKEYFASHCTDWVASTGASNTLYNTAIINLCDKVQELRKQGKSRDEILENIESTHKLTQQN